MYGYWLQEKDHYAADRAAADAMTEQFPRLPRIARANRAFLGRAVRFAARQGIRQFLDLGSGLPISPNVHEIAQSADPGARVVYVDHDPVVLAHARALLAADENVSVVAGDIRDPGGLLRRKSFNAGIDADAPCAFCWYRCCISWLPTRPTVRWRHTGRGCRRAATW